MGLKIVHAILGIAFVAIFGLASLQFYVGNPMWIGTMLLAALLIFATRQVYLAICKKQAGYIVHQRTGRFW